VGLGEGLMSVESGVPVGSRVGLIERAMRIMLVLRLGVLDILADCEVCLKMVKEKMKQECEDSLFIPKPVRTHDFPDY